MHLDGEKTRKDAKECILVAALEENCKEYIKHVLYIHVYLGCEKCIEFISFQDKSLFYHSIPFYTILYICCNTNYYNITKKL